MKRILTIVLALALCLAIPCPAFAAEEPAAPGISVMWEGSYVSFPDAQPAIRNDRTMIPIRAFMECTGADVDYQAGTVILTAGDAVISFRPGTLTADVTVGGKTETITMDTAPYIAQDRTYVPLRFFNQALGYDVLWDAENRAAVILDPEKTIAALDANFKVLNGLLEASKEEMNKTYQTKAAVTGNLTVYDPELGVISGDLTMNVNGLSKGNSADLTMDWDLTSLMSALLGSMEPLTGEDAAAAAEAEALIQPIAKSGAQILLSGEDGKLYVQSPLFSVLGPLVLGEGVNLPANTWLSTAIDLSLLETVQDMTIGSLLYDMFLDNAYGVAGYEMMFATAEELAALIGDANFTRSGSGWTMNKDFTEVGELGEVFDEFTLKLTMQDSGTFSGSLVIAGDDAGDAIEITMNFNGNKTSCTMDLCFDVENFMKMTMNLKETIQETTAQLRSAPPADALVVDLDALLGVSLMDMITASADLSALAG